MRSLSIISEYEHGRKLPALETALKLEILYQTPLAELFPDLYRSLSSEVEMGMQKHSFQVIGAATPPLNIQGNAPRLTAVPQPSHG